LKGDGELNLSTLDGLVSSSFGLLMFNVFTVLDLFISSLAHPSPPSSPLPGIKHRRKASHPSEVIDCLDPSTFLGMSLEAGKTAIVVADVVICINMISGSEYPRCC
jgi:hypothetical protein